MHSTVDSNRLSVIVVLFAGVIAGGVGEEPGEEGATRVVRPGVGLRWNKRQ